MINVNSTGTSSIISRNIDQLGKKFIDNVRYEDIDYRGFVPDNGDPTLEAGYVLVNDLKLWLQSTRGDYYRRWGFGGPLDDLRDYSLTEQGASDLRASLLQGISTHFKTIEVQVLEVHPNVAQRLWRISMIVKDTISGLLAHLDNEFDILE
mgnify:CR=1 FL=1|jgi:hypothetical protein